MKDAKENCAFCKLLSGEWPMSLVYQDDLISVIVDLFPVHEGHILVIPNEHYPYVRDVPESTIAHMMKIAQKMNASLRKSEIKSEGVNFHLSDSNVAGQEIFHCHLHVIPRFLNDGFGFRSDPSRHYLKSERKRMDQIAKTLKENMSF